jgi:ubiquinone/menaquinone biosynthesis C-methylase UbiE
VSDVDRHRLAFEQVADAYERSRPQYAPGALAWLAQRLPLKRVLDLAAGTGKLTRQLVPLAKSVVAVEPGDQMRAVLERVLPEVESLAGSAEAIPLPDGSVDAITVAQAFHWFDVDAALAEMHRVLRPRGGFAVLWNEWDLAELNAMVDRLRKRRSRDDEPRERLLASPLFTNFEERAFSHAERVDVEIVVERAASVSAVIVADEDEREAALEEIRQTLGEGTIDFPMSTMVIAADRV